MATTVALTQCYCFCEASLFFPTCWGRRACAWVSLSPPVQRDLPAASPAAVSTPLPSWPPSSVLFCFFQIFLSYTEAGSSFVFGEALVKDVFAFQVS